VIDFGNTLVKTAIFCGEDITELFTEKTLELSILRNLTQKYPAKHAIVSSVISVPQEIQDFLNDHFILTELSHKTPVPIENLYKTPETLGRDRLAVAVAAHKIFPGSAVLAIDAGTCITFDFLDASGKYYGGGISPGINMRFKALHTFTQRLPLVKHQNFEALSGATTEESILSGVLNGIIAEVDGIIAEYHDLNDGLKVMITGGDMNFFAKKLKSNIFATPNLVLKGLNEILNFNVRQQKARS
jgi:type III pantothenate kinase